MLRIEHVSKTYEPPGRLVGLLVRTAQRSPVRALVDVDLTVAPGEIVGIVGPNGAGKSTLIRICTALLTPTTGRVLLDGQDLATADPSVRARIGLVLAEERALYWRLTGRQNLEFFARMSGLSAAAARTTAGQALEDFGLADRDRRVFGYSSGMRVRLSLARALIPQPDLVILDEPTRSLDPVASEELQTRLRGLADQGRAVLLASHRLDEVEAVCDRVLVLLDGRQEACLETATLRSSTSGIAAHLRELLTAQEQQ